MRQGAVEIPREVDLADPLQRGDLGPGPRGGLTLDAQGPLEAGQCEVEVPQSQAGKAQVQQRYYFELPSLRVELLSHRGRGLGHLPANYKRQAFFANEMSG